MKTSTFALAALMSVSATAAFALDATTSQDVGSTMTEESAASENDGSQAGATGDFKVFMQDFGKADFTSANSGIDAATTFRFVHISNLANADKTELAAMMAPMKGQIADLTSRVSANANAVNQLTNEGFTPLDVVFATVGENGAVTLYIDDIDKKTN